MEELLQNVLNLALLSAPWLLLGLLAAGLIRAWLPVELVGHSLGGSGLGPVTRAAVIGAPLPLCSCGTLPAAISLYRSGASRASTTSFLVATPETGVDSVALSWVLLGPFLALFRPVAAIFSAVVAGLLVGRSEGGGRPDRRKPHSPQMERGERSVDGCCQQGCGGRSAARGFWRRTREGLVYAFSDLLDDISLWLAAGILAAGMVLTLVPPDLLASWGSGLGAMLLMLVISVPMYVCATASTPLAAAMLYAGVSPGTVLVFLLAGPASNMASLALVRRELGGRALVAYLSGVAGVALMLGLGVDLAVAVSGYDPLAGMAGQPQSEAELPIALQLLSLLLLAVCAVPPVRRWFSRGQAGDKGGCCG